MATNITKKEAIKHYLLPNRNTLHIYEDLSKKKKKKTNHAFKVSIYRKHRDMSKYNTEI